MLIGRNAMRVSEAVDTMALKEAEIDGLQSLIAKNGNQATGVNYARALFVGVGAFFAIIIVIIVVFLFG